MSATGTTGQRRSTAVGIGTAEALCIDGSEHGKAHLIARQTYEEEGKHVRSTIELCRAGGMAAKGGHGGAGRGRGRTAPTTDGDNNGEHVADGDGAWHTQGAGTA